MVEKHKALGRGLESLLPPRPFSNPPTLSPTTGEKGGAPVGGKGGAPAYPTLSPKPGEEEPALSLPKGGAPTALLPGEAVMEIPLDLLDDNPYQTRTQLDEHALHELCDSIRALGVLEPILVRPTADGRYQVTVAGSSRYRQDRGRRNRRARARPAPLPNARGHSNASSRASRFESPELHQLVRKNSGGFPAPKIIRRYRA